MRLGANDVPRLTWAAVDIRPRLLSGEANEAAPAALALAISPFGDPVKVSDFWTLGEMLACFLILRVASPAFPECRRMLLGRLTESVSGSDRF